LEQTGEAWSGSYLMVGDNDNAVGEEDTADRWELGDIWSAGAGERRDGCAVRS